MRRVGGHVEDVEHAVVEAAGPEEAAVVREVAVMGFMPAADRDGGHDLAVIRRLGVGADGDQLVGAVAHALDPERPDVDVVLLAGDLRHVGRHAGLVAAGGRRREEDRDEDEEEHAARQSDLCVGVKTSRPSRRGHVLTAPQALQPGAATSTCSRLARTGRRTAATRDIRSRGHSRMGCTRSRLGRRRAASTWSSWDILPCTRRSSSGKRRCGRPSPRRRVSWCGDTASRCSW